MTVFAQQPARPIGAIGLVVLLGMLIGLAPWQWLLAALLVLLPLLDPVLGLGLLILSITAQDALRLPGGLTLTQVAAPLAIMGGAVWVLAHPKRRLGLGRSSAAWGIFLTVLLVATSLGPYGSGEGLKELWRWGIAFVAWFLTVIAVRRPWQVALVIGCLIAGPLINAVIGLNQFVSGDGPPAFRISADLPYMRAYGTLGQPNSFAAYLNMAWPLALAVAIGISVRALQPPQPTDTQHAQPGRWRVAMILLAVGLWSATAILLAALAASFSRGAWIGAVVGLLGLLLAVGGRSARIGLIVVGGITVLLILGGAQFLPPTIAERLRSISGSLRLFDPSTVTVTPANFAVVERMAQLWAGWKMFLAYPLLGVGPGNYSNAYPEFTSGPWFASRGHAHNYYLHIAAEAGLLGVLSYLILLASAVSTVRRALIRASAGIRRAALIGICGIIAATVGHNLFEHVHVLHMTIQLVTVWGLALALARSFEGT